MAKKPINLVITGENASALKALNEVGAASEKSARRTAAASKRHAAAMDKMSTTAMVAGGAMLAGFGGIVAVAGRFEQEISKVGAVSGATGTELEKLSEAALKAGADTAFSASQAAQAEAELAKAGISTADILGGGLRGALALAAAGQIDLAQAAEISAQTMNLFGLAGKDVTRIADTLAAGANKSAADIQTLADGLKQGGLVAKQTGLSLEETVGALALFADNALVGSDAGTSLKSMLQRLSNPSKEAKKRMDELGVAMYDANGQFVGLETLAGNLRDAFDDLTPAQRNAAMATIFGADSVRAAAILFESGAKGAREYTKAVSDQGAASRVASQYLDNLSGDLEALKGSIETALIQGGSKATGALRSMTQAATGLVNAFADAPDAVQTTVIAFGGITGASLLAVGGIMKVASAAKSTKAAFLAMSPTAVAGVTALGAAVAVGGLALAEWGREKEQARIKTQQFTDALRADTGAFGANTREMIRNSLVSGDLLDDLAKLNGFLSSGRAPIDVYTDAVQGNVEAQQELRRAILDSGSATVYWTGVTDENRRKIENAWVETGGNIRDVALDVIGPAFALPAIGFSDLDQALTDNIATLGRAKKAYEAEAGAKKDSAQIARDLTAAETELKDAISLHGATSEQAKAAKQRYNTALAAQRNLDREVAQAQRDVTAGMAANAAAADNAGGPLGRYAQRLREVRDMFRDATAAGREFAYTSSIVTITNPNALPSIPGRAGGGPVSRGEAYVIGEQGPELFVPGKDGTIIPNGAMNVASRAGGGMGGTIMVQVEVNVDPITGRKVYRLAQEDQRRNGPWNLMLSPTAA
jgi:TP901 family phage tail tape measure protein